MSKSAIISDLSVRDIRFPTSLEQAGSDAVNIDPDYSCGYVTIKTNTGLEGYGITFTIGRGNDIVCLAIKAYRRLVIGRNLDEIYSNFASFFRELTGESQLRWLGPEKGVVHLAVAAIINALWDLWARIEGKPLWKLLSDMDPEKLISTIDFTYITDALTPEEALVILKEGQKGKTERESELKTSGYPAYTTSMGWLGFSDEKITRLCNESLSAGFTRFKVKIGSNLEDDKRRISLIRKTVGDDKMLLTDSNQRFDVNEAIDWMKHLAKYNITWIEEPTSPDDVLGHAAISKALKPYGIGVATGEHCQNRVMFKQFLTSGAMQFCQIDSCRLAGVNEVLAVILMAAKFNVPVCPHGGGVGLCELIQHYSIFDYIAVSKSLDRRVVEYVGDDLHRHFIEPIVMKNGCYQLPQQAGFSSEMKEKSLSDHEYPSGAVWQTLFEEGKFEKPTEM